MPRRARIMLPGVPVHIVQRGNNRGPCFFADQDRRFYLFHLRRMLDRARCELHAYCLMTNHVHLLVTPGNADSCALLMKHVGQLYSQYVNRLYGRSGSLWESRFRSCLVQSSHYVLACYRYIESNPVRAGIALRPRDYEWSSYRQNAEGAGDPPVTPHAELQALGLGDRERRRAYASLFETAQPSALVDELRAAISGGYVLGDDSFERTVAGLLGRRVIKGLPGRPLGGAGNRSQPSLLEE